MPSKRIFDNRTRRFNERRIDRNLVSWGNGLVLDIKDPSQAFLKLYNAVDHATEIRGRQGTLLYNLADYGINVLDTESFTEALDPGGVLENAQVGEKFIVYNFKDFSDGALRTAKNNQNNGIFYLLPYAYDVYEIIEDGVVKPKFLGNILIPAYNNLVPYNDGSDKTFIGFKSGFDVTLSDIPGDIFEENIVGKYLFYGSIFGDTDYVGRREIIKNFVANGAIVITVDTDENEGNYNYLMVQPQIWANHYYQKKNMIFIQAGEKIYYSTIPFYGWKECVFLTSVKPSESDSKFEQIGSEIILTNTNGKFRFMFKDNDVFVWIMNSDFEKIKPKNAIKYFFGFQSSKPNLEGENPYSFRGFSNRDILLNPDRRGGQWL